MNSKIKGRFDPITDLELEQYLCGDLSKEKCELINNKIKQSQELSDYINDRKADKKAFYMKNPVLKIIKEKKESLFSRFFLLKNIYAVSGAAAAIILLLFIFPLQNIDNNIDSKIPNITIKGSFKAELYVLRNGETFVYNESVPLRKNDRVRLKIESPVSGFLTMIIKDDKNDFTSFYSNLQTTKSTFTVNDSLILDDSTNIEHWFVFLSKKPVSSDVLIEKLKNQIKINVPMSVLKIIKENSN